MRLIRSALLAAVLLLAVGGVATAAPVSPASLDFGTNATGSTTSPQAVALTNTGTASVTVSQVTLTGTAANQYSVTDNCSVALAAGQTCEAQVSFSPTTAGAKSAAVNFVTDRGTLSASLTGRGEVAGLSPTVRGFGSVAINTGPGAATVFTVSNPQGSPAAMGLGSVSITGTDANQFITSADSCSNQSVEVGGSCTFSVQFSPTSAGAKSGSVSIARTGDTALSATLTGTGAAPAVGAVEIAPSSISFGTTVPVGSTQGPAAATLYNRTAEYVNLGQVTIAGANPGQYRLEQSADQCSGQAIAPGGSCGVAVSFKPTSNGSKPAQLQIPQSGGATVYSRNLTGTAIAATVEPYNLNFGSVALGETSEALTGTINNVSDQSLTVNTAALAGANPAMYELIGSADQCTGVTIPAGASCEFQVRFTPTVTGTRAASISFTTTMGAVSYPLTGVGDAIYVSPSTLEFGAHSIATGPSTERQFTVRNADTNPVDFHWVFLSGTGADQFEVTGETCTSATVAVGATCSVSVTFDPSVAGTQTATLNLLSNSGLQSVRTATASGDAVTEKVAVTPARVDFGLTTIGDEPLAKTVIVTNTSGGRTTIGQILADGPFGLAADSCSGVTLESAGTCAITVSFTPATVGQHRGGLEVPVPSTGSTYTNVLLGRAEARPEPPEPTVIKPKVKVRPVLKGKARQGARLTCSKGSWQNTPTSFTYAWLRNGKVVKGKKAAGYRLVRADVGKRIRCRVTAANKAGKTVATSKRVVKVKALKKKRNKKGTKS